MKTDSFAEDPESPDSQNTSVSVGPITDVGNEPFRLQAIIEVQGSASPLAWLIAARRIPELASLLHSSASHCDSQPLSNAEWTNAFCQRPAWQKVAQLLAAKRDSIVFDPDALLLANISRSISVATGWFDPDAAYWGGLVARRPDAVVESDVYLGNENELNSQILAIAELLLRLSGRRTFFANQKVSTEIERFEFLCGRHPAVDWAGLVSEARELPKFEATTSLTAIERALLHSWSSSNATNVELALLRTFHRISCAPRITEAVSIFREEFVSNFPMPLGIWIAGETGETGIGISIGRESMTSVSDCCRLEEFESTLGPPLRFVSELSQNNRHRLGRAYSARVLLAEEVESLQLILPAIPSIGAISEPRRKQSSVTTSVKGTGEQDSRTFQDRIRAAIVEFSAGAGHEINNPLGTISGKVQWLLPAEVDPKRRAALQKITEQVDRIHRMIRDLHFIGRTTQGIRKEAPLGEILSKACAIATSRRAPQQLTLDHVPAEWMVTGNQEDLVRMFSELIRNAIEASGEEGRVAIEASTPVEGDERIEVRIRDSGPGFTEQDRRHAFDPFYSGRSAGRGLGMGLCVAQKIAEDHQALLMLGLGRPTTITVLIRGHRRIEGSEL